MLQIQVLSANIKAIAISVLLQTWISMMMFIVIIYSLHILKDKVTHMITDLGQKHDKRQESTLMWQPDMTEERYEVCSRLEQLLLASTHNHSHQCNRVYIAGSHFGAMCEDSGQALVRDDSFAHQGKWTTMSDGLIDKLMRHRRLEKTYPHTPGQSPQIIDFHIFHLAVFTLQKQSWYLNDTR